MNNLAICISEETINTYIENGLIVDLHLFISSNGIFFPDESWTDFAIPMFCIWAEQLLRNKGKKTRYSLFFMDGPYRIDVEQDKNSSVLKGICTIGEDYTVFEEQVDIPFFANELYSVLCKIERLFDKGSIIIESNKRKELLDVINHYLTALRELACME